MKIVWFTPVWQKVMHDTLVESLVPRHVSENEYGRQSLSFEDHVGKDVDA